MFDFEKAKFRFDNQKTYYNNVQMHSLELEVNTFEKIIGKTRLASISPQDTTARENTAQQATDQK
ncbi:MAG: hypothetical protein ACJA1H_000361 [Glaciecola sp.]|jgi:hypothetical protein